MPPMPPITPGELTRLAESLGLPLAEDEREEIDTLHALAEGFIGGLDLITSCPEPERPSVPFRESSVPSPEANPLGAWVTRTSVRERADGRLAGRTLALKDNIALAGVPMAGGSDFLNGYVPEEDATIVRRVLDEGVEIVGKATCEYLSASGGSHTSASGRVRNPHDPTRTSGGSSSGCGALVASGEVDLAIGGDQGGSIRFPASYCGIVGMKPTHGLVPYTGILSIDAHIDHTGPMTANVMDNAMLLEVLAGSDGLDPRQGIVATENYSTAASRGVEGLRIGVLTEGFHESVDPGVEASVRDAIASLESRGAHVVPVSVPNHAVHGGLVLPFLLIGGFELIAGGGFPSHACQPIPFGLAEAFARWRTHNEEMPPNVKLMLLVGAHARAHGGEAVYAKAVRLREAARQDYDRVLAEIDALVMPTTPTTAPPLPSEAPSFVETMRAISTGVANTAQFDATGHPAISVPSNASRGLPVGSMFVGRYWDEATLYRLAAAVEADRE
ncbi:MAG: amidase [bacterium]|nr:Asp-tRNA(Asn)/Glu-tRNA(Gln) amidotransferase GatCAB subunit A [Deltaproteobacteria bacterium]MCP4908754.1 amidase [bacterium]